MGRDGGGGKGVEFGGEGWGEIKEMVMVEDRE